MVEQFLSLFTDKASAMNVTVHCNISPKPVNVTVHCNMSPKPVNVTMSPKPVNGHDEGVQVLDGKLLINMHVMIILMH